MVRLMSFHASQISNLPSIPLAMTMFVSASLLVALCTKHVRKYSKKTMINQDRSNMPHGSPLQLAAKQLITTVSHKAMVPLVHAKNSGFDFKTKIFGINSMNNNKNDNKLGREKDGMWQKAILMGEKCQPLEFSGVIYYDYDGYRIPEMPKSPRAGGMSPMRNVTCPMEKIDKSMY